MEHDCGGLGCPPSHQVANLQFLGQFLAVVGQRGRLKRAAFCGNCQLGYACR